MLEREGPAPHRALRRDHGPNQHAMLERDGFPTQRERGIGVSHQRVSRISSSPFGQLQRVWRPVGDQEVEGAQGAGLL